MTRKYRYRCLLCNRVRNSLAGNGECLVCVDKRYRSGLTEDVLARPIRKARLSLYRERAEKGLPLFD